MNCFDGLAPFAITAPVSEGHCHLLTATIRYANHQIKNVWIKHRLHGTIRYVRNYQSKSSYVRVRILNVSPCRLVYPVFTWLW